MRILCLAWLAVLALVTACSVRDRPVASARTQSLSAETPAESAPSESYGYEYANDSTNAPFEAGAASPTQPVAQAAPPSAPRPEPGMPGAGAIPAAPDGRALPDAATGPLLIYTAQVHLAVYETQKARTAAEKLIQTFKGYLVRQSDRSLTFRVPAEHFQAALEQVLSLGDVIHRDVVARDVTEEFFDVQTRTRTLEAMRDRLEELLRKAQNVEQALAVERELGRVVEEIERLKGKLKLLRELIAFSTISIEFQPRAVESLKSGAELPFPWLKSLGLGQLLTL